MAGGIVEALERARYRAKRAGRSKLTFEDIRAAVTIDHLGAPATAVPTPLQDVCNGDAAAVKTPREGIAKVPHSTNRRANPAFPVHARLDGARILFSRSKRTRRSAHQFSVKKGSENDSRAAAIEARSEVLELLIVTFWTTRSRR
jgi:hypothetical protein